MKGLKICNWETYRFYSGESKPTVSDPGQALTSENLKSCPCYGNRDKIGKLVGRMRPVYNLKALSGVIKSDFHFGTAARFSETFFKKSDTSHGSGWRRVIIGWAEVFSIDFFFLPFSSGSLASPSIPEGPVWQPLTQWPITTLSFYRWGNLRQQKSGSSYSRDTN